MNPYPVLTKLCDCVIFNWNECLKAFWLEGQRDGKAFTPAEVLALADELKAFVNAQTQTTTMAELPSGDPT